MFGIVDLVVVAALKDSLDFLSKNPKHIEFILGQFCLPPINNLVGANHIQECISAIQNQRIEVAPYYQMDLKKRPSVAVVASYTEVQQFIGDEGSDHIQKFTLPAKEYASFDAKAINGCTMSVSAQSNLDKILWPGLYLFNGTKKVTLKGILVREGEDTKLMLSEELPAGTKMQGWKALSSIHEKAYHVNSSIDEVTVQCNLQTVGDFSVHRLMATVIRYCLKKQRLWLDDQGFQVATYSQTPPLLTEEGEGEFQTVFTITGKFTDSWIAKEYDLPDSAANITIGLVAHSDTLEEERDDVVLDE